MPQTLQPPHLDVVPSLTTRCDGCAAAAKLELILRTGGELAFCGHHANRLAGDIVRQAVRVTVENGFLWRGATDPATPHATGPAAPRPASDTPG
jgi:hypothetical protein